MAPGTKTAKSRTVWLPYHLVEPLRKHFDGNRVFGLENPVQIDGERYDLVFRSLTGAAPVRQSGFADAWHPAAERSGVTQEYVTEYERRPRAPDLRAGFATTAELNGVSDLELMRALGHKDPDVMRQYVRPKDRVGLAAMAAVAAARKG